MSSNPEESVACDCSPERHAFDGFVCYGCRYERHDHCACGRREFPLYQKPCGWRREKEAENDEN